MSRNAPRPEARGSQYERADGAVQRPTADGRARAEASSDRSGHSSSLGGVGEQVLAHPQTKHRKETAHLVAPSLRSCKWSRRPHRESASREEHRALRWMATQ